MLKIKDDVNLKELEKFGFEKQPLAIFCYDGYCNGDVEIAEDGILHHRSFNSTYELDSIYDLIKADLVEKC